MSIYDVIISFFGRYTPLTGTYYLWDEVQETYIEVVQPIAGVAGVNWPWISGVAVVLVTLFCLFRIVGGLFKGALR